MTLCEVLFVVCIDISAVKALGIGPALDRPRLVRIRPNAIWFSHTIKFRNRKGRIERVTY